MRGLACAFRSAWIAKNRRPDSRESGLLFCYQLRGLESERRLDVDAAASKSRIDLVA